MKGTSVPTQGRDAMKRRLQIKGRAHMKGRAVVAWAHMKERVVVVRMIARVIASRVTGRL